MTRPLAAVLAALALTACGADGTPAAHSPSPTPSPTSAPPTAAATARLVATLALAGTYAHGARYILRVETSVGAQVTERTYESPAAVRLDLPLAPGAYRIVSYQRPCREAGCGGRQGDPADICGAKFTVVAAEVRHATVALRAEDGCTVHVT